MLAGGSHAPPSDHQSTHYPLLPLLSIRPQCRMGGLPHALSPILHFIAGSIPVPYKRGTHTITFSFSFLPHLPVHLYFEIVDHLNSQPQSSEPIV